MPVLYLDSSAVYKLLASEAETVALMAFLPAWPRRATSALTKVEVGRALLRAGLAMTVAERERLLWLRTVILALEPAVLDRARRLEPPALRSLDAIHLASALTLGEDLAGLVTYDRRLLAAAQAAGIRAWAPH